MIKQDILEGRALIVVDGSVKDNIATYGAAITNHNEDYLLVYDGSVPVSQVASSFRAEMYGAIEIAQTVYCLAGKPVNLELHMVCNNEKAGEIASSDAWNYRQYIGQNGDLIENRRKLQENGIQLNIRWIKAHQSVEKDSPLEVQLNAICDEIAKDIWREGRYVQKQMENATTVITNSERCQAQIKTHLEDWVDWQRYETYNRRKFKEAFDEIDHETWRHCINPKVAKCETVKICNRQQPYGESVQRMYKTNVWCLHCKESETWEHVYMCKELCDFRLKFIDDLAEKLNKTQFEPFAQTMAEILSELREHFIHKEIAAESMQAKVGYSRLFAGCLSIQWTEREAYINEKYTSKSFCMWKRTIVIKSIRFYSKCWTQCNEKHHKCEKTNMDTVIQKHNFKRIIQLYKLKNEVLRMDRNLFKDDQQAWRTADREVQQKWIESVNQALERKKKDDRKMHDIRKFFPLNKGTKDDCETQIIQKEKNRSAYQKIKNANDRSRK